MHEKPVARHKVNKSLSKFDAQLGNRILRVFSGIVCYDNECAQFVSRTEISKFATLNACKELVIKCDGLLYGLLWRVSLSVLKINKIWLPWLLI